MFARGAMARRDFVRLGCVAGLGLAEMLRGRRASAAGATGARAKHCILIWLDGGPSHLDLWDPKPETPAEVRGPFRAIETAVPGIQFSELLPKSAAIADQLAVVRSVTSPLGEHNLGTHYLLTGYRPTPALHYPTFGSVLAELRPGAGELPPFVAVPDMRVGGAAFVAEGFLSAARAPLEVGADPATPDFRVPYLDPSAELGVQRVVRRRSYLQALEAWRRQRDQLAEANNGSIPSDGGEPLGDAASDQAFQLTTSQSARQAFQLSDEPDAVRARYGPRSIGQSCLLARRLIERGVSLVTVNHSGWDTHNDMVTRLQSGYTGATVPVGLGPSLDMAFAALIDDLRTTGLLDETLVVVMGEFGRTPKLNNLGGRDHWPRVFSVVMAGAGIEGGQVVGRSDPFGESPDERPVTPSDLAATLYHLLGIDPATRLWTPDGRPVALNLDGAVIRELTG